MLLARVGEAIGGPLDRLHLPALVAVVLVAGRPARSTGSLGPGIAHGIWWSGWSVIVVNSQFADQCLVEAERCVEAETVGAASQVAEVELVGVHVLDRLGSALLGEPVGVDVPASRQKAEAASDPCQVRVERLRAAGRYGPIQVR